MFIFSIRAAHDMQLMQMCSNSLDTAILLNIFSWQVTLPFLVLHGGDDIVTDPSVSKLLFEEASGRDKTFKLYPGMWHALTAELPDDVELVYSDIISWLDERSDCAGSVPETF